MYFRCDFRTELSNLTGEPDDFVTALVGDLYGVLDDELREDPKLAGKARLFIINADAAEQAGMPLFDVLDVRSETAPYVALLNFNEVGMFSAQVDSILGDDAVLSQNMLILDRLEVLPNFRGNELALQYMRAAIARFGLGCRMVAIKPYPLQFEVAPSDPEDASWRNRLGLESITGNQRAATARLKKYYAREGFVAVKGTELMILDLERNLADWHTTP